MANDKRIGCEAGKTTLVDPNMFDGQSSFTNISVPLEDLSIYVQLETTKRARTILTSSADGDKNVGISSKGAVVKFIEGSEVGGHKVLTTNYTDLTTNFGEESGTETLGITSIDIDFNPSQTPMITINFVDLRGSAIFQNEAKISGGQNKYATFFQLPYPIYTLTVKGYYGSAVSYDLHMLKFSAKFNSKTGNFEITASFIGYTYAMLSDMLLGYLKAIPYTKYGKIKYAKMRETNKDLLTLDELSLKISSIDDALKNIKSSDEDMAVLGNGAKASEALITIRNNVTTLGRDLDVQPLLDEYRFIFPKIEGEPAKALETYTTNVKANIKIYNDLSVNKIDENDFIGSKLLLYQSLTVKMLKDDDIVELQKVDKLGKGDTEEDFERTIDELISYVTKNEIASEMPFDIYDLRQLYKIISEKNVANINDTKVLRKTLGLKLKSEVAGILKFDPTVRKIIEVFTASVEALMFALYQVSADAMSKEKVARVTQLKKFAPDSNPTKPQSYDYKVQSVLPTNDKSTGPLDPIYYPWPEYRVDDELDGLTETYLGDPGVLDVPKDVTELAFIDDLLAAFLTSARKNEEAGLIAEQGTSNWYPVNPLDTRLFMNEFPYTRLKRAAKKDVCALLMLRAFTYFGLSVSSVKATELEALAIAETNAILATFASDESLLMSLTQLTEKDFLDAAALNGEKNFQSIFKPIDIVSGHIWQQTKNLEYYSYIFPSDGSSKTNSPQTAAEAQKVVPINRPFQDVFTQLTPSVVSNGYTLTQGTDNNVVKMAENGNLFLTNYKSSEDEYTLGNLQKSAEKKPYDGGIYIKMFTVKEYDGPNRKTLPSVPPAPTGPNLINFDGLKAKQLEFSETAANFSQFGGNYGIQELRFMNFGSELPPAPFMVMFYQKDGYKNGNAVQLVKSSGFAFKRETDPITRKTVSTEYDMKADTIYFTLPTSSVIGNQLIQVTDSAFDEMIDTLGRDEIMHKQYGDNRVLAADYKLNKNPNISFPYVFFQVAYDVDDSNIGEARDDSTPVSLFGSRFYYGQTSEYSKAFLFLHTLPWNGLTMDWDIGTFYNSQTDYNGVFNRWEILNTFGNRAGFVFAPKVWAAFIGGLLWRADFEPSVFDASGLQVDGGSSLNDPILWKDSIGNQLIPSYTSSSAPANRWEYLTANHSVYWQDAPMMLANNLPSIKGYRPLEQMLIHLPQQAKDEFKKVFWEFVGDGKTSDWGQIKISSEVYSGSLSGWDTAFSDIMKEETLGGGFVGTKSNGLIRTSYLKSKLNATNNGKPVIDDYVIFTPYENESDFVGNYFAELRDDSQAVSSMLKILTDEIIIANMSIKIWQKKTDAGDNPHVAGARGAIYVDTEVVLKPYIQHILTHLKPAEGSSVTDKKKQLENELFGTDNENLIKFQLYRTCKNLYDKWIGGAKDDSSLIFRGGEVSRNSIDRELAAKAGRTTLQLIDSFRFVTRSFRDIGDEMIINPVPVAEFLRNNPNSSFYDAVTSLLSSNNFVFIPLPTFINYGDKATLQKIFTPTPSNEAFKEGVVGPAFVCVYAGQTSKHLDFPGSEYPNDGISFTCDNNGNLNPVGGKDFVGEAKPYENKVAVFAVNYSQQNQNIFKDITIDQAEFSETAESLQITDEISQKGGEHAKTFGGQNMFNVYSVRSYTVGVEMMGNAMIQPMMYFQLNNIPLFHGGYLIQHVTHSIRPNTMSTHFTGTRIRNVETPIMDVGELFMSLLDSIEATGVAETNKQFGTTPSGGKNPVGNNRAIYAPYVDYDVLPTDSLKYQEVPYGGGDTWTMKEMGVFIQDLSVRWNAKNASLTNTDTIYVNNFGAWQGGTNKKHGGDGGLHSVGLACDLQPMAKTKPKQKCIVGEVNYNQAKNIEFIQMVIDLSAEYAKKSVDGGQIIIQNIILNDDVITSHFSSYKNSAGGKVVIQVDGHKNHIHLEFDYPPRVLLAIKNNPPTPVAIASSATAGQVTTNPVKLPTKTEKISALGQI